MLVNMDKKNKEGTLRRIYFGTLRRICYCLSLSLIPFLLGKQGVLFLLLVQCQSQDRYEEEERAKGTISRYNAAPNDCSPRLLVLIFLDLDAESWGLQLAAIAKAQSCMQHMAVEEGRILPIQSYMHDLALFHSRTAHKQAKLYTRKAESVSHHTGKGKPHKGLFSKITHLKKGVFRRKKSINEQLCKDAAGERASTVKGAVRWRGGAWIQKIEGRKWCDQTASAPLAGKQIGERWWPDRLRRQLLEAFAVLSAAFLIVGSSDFYEDVWPLNLAADNS